MDDTQVVARSVSLYPNDWAVVEQIAKDTGQRSFSGGLRYIIADWARMKAREAGIDIESWNEHAPRADGRVE